MALVLPAGGLISGKLNGVVYAHNSGGQYVRDLGTPVDPNTTLQQFWRGAAAVVKNRWRLTLTDGQRHGWAEYAATLDHQNRLGQSIRMSGWNAFFGPNIIRYLFAVPFADDSPSRPGRTGLAPVRVELTVGVPSTAEVFFDPSDEWATHDDGILVLHQGMNRPDTVNFYNGPWRSTGSVRGDSTTPPTSPKAFSPSAYAPSASGRQRFRIRSISGDGRLSPVQFVYAVKL